MPLLFETALQAQFLKPMVISLSFGLMFGTLIVLFLLPAFLTGLESLRQRFNRIETNTRPFLPDTDDLLEILRHRRLTRHDPSTVQSTGGNSS